MKFVTLIAMDMVCTGSKNILISVYKKEIFLNDSEFTYSSNPQIKMFTVSMSSYFRYRLMNTVNLIIFKYAFDVST